MNIDTVGIVKTVAAVSGKKIGNTITQKSISSNKETLKIEGGFFKKKEKQALVLTPDEQMDATRKLKSLLDEGAITQEEYEKKKKEIMSL